MCMPSRNVYVTSGEPILFLLEIVTPGDNLCAKLTKTKIENVKKGSIKGNQNIPFKAKHFNIIQTRDKLSTLSYYCSYSPLFLNSCESNRNGPQKRFYQTRV